MRKTLSLLFGLFMLLPPFGAQAAIFNVTNPTNFQNALDNAAVNGVADTINVTAGTYPLAATLSYNPPVDASSLTILGAGAATTILDGGANVEILSINTTGLADGAASIVVNGLTFRNGSANADGAGMLIQTTGANITVENSAFSGNAAGNDGGGGRVQTATGAITIINNTFSGNTATRDGAGMRVQAGAAATLSGPATLTNNFLTGNTAGRDGAGFRAQTDGGAPLVATNNRLTGNTATGDGGGLRVAAVGGTLTLTNNSIVGNTAAAGGGILVEVPAGDTAQLYNNIIIDNTAPPLVGQDIRVQNVAGSLTNLTNNNFAGLFALAPAAVGQANTITATPPGLSADLHLLAGSPCIDVGFNIAPALPAIDIDGEARIMGLTGIVDIGADEFFVLVPPGPGPAPGPVPTGTVVTTLTLSARPRVIRAGRASVLRGILMDINGTGLAGKRVAIKTGTRTIKNVTTQPGGAYSFRIRPARTRKFSAAFAGDATYRPAASRVVRVVVR